VIGLLDVPDSFLDPARVQAALIWFGRGNVEYKFPNNAKLLNAAVESVEFSMELSSETPGTNMDWPSDIALWVNDIAIGTDDFHAITRMIDDGTIIARPAQEDEKAMKLLRLLSIVSRRRWPTDADPAPSIGVPPPKKKEPAPAPSGV
jgi:hypothetical protein